MGEFGGVIALFEKAKEYLKYPKITLALPDGSPLQLNLAGKGSKFPGTVGLTDGGSYGDNKWYGRVTKEGAWEPAKLSDQLKTDLIFDPRPARHPARPAGGEARQAHRPLLLLQLRALRREVDQCRLRPGLRQALGPAAWQQGELTAINCKRFDSRSSRERLKDVDKTFVPRRAP